MKILLLFIVLNVSPIISQEIEECVFDQTTQTDEFIKKKGEFKKYEWNKETKTATVKLESGNVLRIFRGGCVHFGMSGELEILDNVVDLSDTKYWLEKALWISEKVFEDSDNQFLNNQLTSEHYSLQSDSNSFYIFIPHKYYDEFSIAVRKENGKVFLYVGYYFS